MDSVFLVHSMLLEMMIHGDDTVYDDSENMYINVFKGEYDICGTRLSLYTRDHDLTGGQYDLTRRMSFAKNQGVRVSPDDPNYAELYEFVFCNSHIFDIFPSDFSRFQQSFIVRMKPDLLSRRQTILTFEIETPDEVKDHEESYWYPHTV